MFEEHILNYPMLFIMVIAMVLSAIMAIVNTVLIDQKRMKEIQIDVKKHNKELIKATKAQDQDTLKRLEKEKPRINQLQGEMMKMQMPMFAAMLPFFVVFIVLRNLTDSLQLGEFVELPAIIRGGWWGNTWTWLGWYIICSLAFSTLFRRILGVK